MLTESQLIEKLKSYDPTADENLVKQAYRFSKEVHSSQVRASGEPYFSHPLAVANILLDLKLDHFSIITALLHDTVEDTLATLENIKSQFGYQIAQLVDGVTKLSRIELQSEATKQAENFQKLVLAMSSDIRVLLVKLADRTHNMRTLNYVNNESKRQLIAHETMEIYVPLAERMGMREIKEELEDLAFVTLNTEIHDSIKARLKFLHKQSENNIELIIKDIKKNLDQAKITATVSGRLKTPYSIWNKIKHKNVAFEQLGDIMAFRIIVDDITACYQVLGVVHGSYLVIPGRFKDYISTPKPNGYQSLHTGLIGPLNYRIEVQIRTGEMNHVCELGVAAHWYYKRGKFTHDGKQYAWLRSLLEILEHVSSPQEFLEHTKLEMFQDQVFCFTPKGEIISLPKGATPIDFAYAIHSQIGDRTVGTKINGRQMPVRTVLANGDQVEIITHQHQCPSPTWERFVITGRARARIRRFIRGQQRQQFKELGKSILQKACLKEGIAYNEKMLSLAVGHFQYHTNEDLLASVGEGIHTPKEVLAVIQSLQQQGQQPSKSTTAAEDTFNIPPLKKETESCAKTTLTGLIPGMAVHFAGCCHPLPGDVIKGIIITGKGITIHNADCEGFKGVEVERILDLAWPPEDDDDFSYVGRLKLGLTHKPGSLALISNAINRQNSNIINFKKMNRSNDFWELIIDVEVKNLSNFNQIIGFLRTLPIVHNVDRI